MFELFLIGFPELLGVMKTIELPIQNSISDYYILSGVVSSKREYRDSYSGLNIGEERLSKFLGDEYSTKYIKEFGEQKFIENEFFTNGKLAFLSKGKQYNNGVVIINNAQRTNN